MIRVESRDPRCEARTARLQLPHGEVHTPAFIPVGTNGAVKAMRHSALTEIGYSFILGNTYHLYLRPGIQVLAAHGGLHSFCAWEGNIITDSGGYQVFSLAPFRKIRENGVEFRSHIDGSRHFLTPEIIVDVQSLMGSDIQMPLDVCTPMGIAKKEARHAMQLTTEWAGRARIRRTEQPEEYRGALFGIVQGNFYADLRRESAEGLIELDFDGYAIGGLSVGEDASTFRDFLQLTAPLLPEEKPKYVMGIGTPEYMLEAVEAGIDIFDCVHPTRVARNGTCFTADGMLNLKNAHFRDDTSPIEEHCPCSTCRRYSRSYLRHLFSSKEILGPMLLTHHNLHFFYSLMEQVRAAIDRGCFPAFKNSFLTRFSGRIHEG